MSGENSRLFVISPCFYLFIYFCFVCLFFFCFFVVVFFLQVRGGCKVGESLERTNNEISGETKAINKGCTKTTSALSFFFFFFFDARFLIYVFAASYQLGRENKKGSGPPVIIILVIITAVTIITIFSWLNNATRYFSTSLLQAVTTTSLSWSRKKKTLIITETVQTFQVIAICLTIFRGINVEICYALYM